MNITFINISPNVARTYASSREFGIILRARCPRDRGVPVPSPPPPVRSSSSLPWSRKRLLPRVLPRPGGGWKRGAAAVASGNGERVDEGKKKLSRTRTYLSKKKNIYIYIKDNDNLLCVA